MRSNLKIFGSKKYYSTLHESQILVSLVEIWRSAPVQKYAALWATVIMGHVSMDVRTLVLGHAHLLRKGTSFVTTVTHTGQ